MFCLHHGCEYQLWSRTDDADSTLNVVFLFHILQLVKFHLP